jgi:hypothetical protein
MSSAAPLRAAVKFLTVGRELSMTRGGLVLSDLSSRPSGLDGVGGRELEKVGPVGEGQGVEGVDRLRQAFLEDTPFGLAVLLHGQPVAEGVPVLVGRVPDDRLEALALGFPGRHSHSKIVLFGRGSGEVLLDAEDDVILVRELEVDLVGPEEFRPGDRRGDVRLQIEHGHPVEDGRSFPGLGP